MDRRRPLFGLALAWILGVALGRATDPAPLVVWAAAGGTAAVGIGLFRTNRPNWPVAIVAVFIALGGLSYQSAELPTARIYPHLDDLDRVHGVVTNFPTRTSGRTSFVIRSERLPGGVQIRYWHRDAERVLDIAYGERLTIHADVEIPPRLPEFNYRRYLATRDVWGVASVWNAGQIQRHGTEAGSPLLDWAYRTRTSLFASLDAHLPAQQADLMKGLLFGERAQMSDRVEGSFRDAGVMHVLAVSGLHLAILLGLGWTALRRLGRSVTGTYLILLPLVLVYLAIVGFKLSLVRASLMLAFVALGWVVAERGWILKRWVDPLQGLSAAALLILIVHPPSLFTVSFQLSFSATAGILIVLQGALPRLNACRTSLQRRWSVQASACRRWAFAAAERLAMLGLVTVAAQLAVAPVIAWHFGRLYVGAFLANLAIVPIVMVSLWIGVAFLATAALGLATVAGAIGAVLAPTLSLLMGTADGFAGLPWAYLTLERAWLLAGLAMLPALLDVSVLQAWRRRDVRLPLLFRYARSSLHLRDRSFAGNETA